MMKVIVGGQVLAVEQGLNQITQTIANSEDVMNRRFESVGLHIETSISEVRSALQGLTQASGQQQYAAPAASAMGPPTIGSTLGAGWQGTYQQQQPPINVHNFLDQIFECLLPLHFLIHEI